MALERALLAAGTTSPEFAAEFVAEAGMLMFAGVVPIAWLIPTAKKLSPAVYPILASEFAKI